MKFFKQKSVALTPETWSEVAALARQSNSTSSDVVRAAVLSYLKFQKSGFWNPNRVAEVAEFNQLVLAEWLTKTAPEEIDAIADAVRERMSKYHGE